MTKTIFITEKINFQFLLIGEVSEQAKQILKLRGVKFSIDNFNQITIFDIEVLNAQFYINLINYCED